MRASILLIIFGAARCSKHAEMFGFYKEKHSLDFGYDDDYRLEVFKANIEYINEVNSQELPYKLGITPFTHLTKAEFKERMTSTRFYAQHVHSLRSSGFLVKSYSHKSQEDLPPTINWVDKGWVTEVKDQGQCGSCWAFSSTGALEAVHKNVSGELVSLSEQELVDCSGAYGNQGCNGGLEKYSFSYVDAHGLGSEKDYPYETQNDSCRSSGKDRVIKPHTIGYEIVESGSNDALQEAIVDNGPVTIGVDGSTVFQFYKSGIVDSGCGTENNHGVLVVGYNMNSKPPYYLIKNSWGKSWGENGYIRLAITEEGVCGMLEEPVFPFSKSK